MIDFIKEVANLFEATVNRNSINSNKPVKSTAVDIAYITTQVLTINVENEEATLCLKPQAIKQFLKKAEKITGKKFNSENCKNPTNITGNAERIASNQPPN